MQVASLNSIKDIIDHRSRSQRSNNGSKMAEFRHKSRYLKKLLTDFNDFWLRRCRMQVASLDLIKDIMIIGQGHRGQITVPKWPNLGLNQGISKSC